MLTDLRIIKLAPIDNWEPVEIAKIKIALISTEENSLVINRDRLYNKFLEILSSMEFCEVPIICEYLDYRDDNIHRIFLNKYNERLISCTTQIESSIVTVASLMTINFIEYWNNRNNDNVRTEAVLKGNNYINQTAREMQLFSK